MRHILGVLGVLAASVLLVVSAMMNYQFGSSLGRTPTDSHIYGMASAAADCFKALAPFFFFAAIRNRVWSQALAAALVWVVVTGYAFTSALGHAALNRFATSGERVAAGANYKDLRADLKRAEDQLKWIPPHRPPSTVEAELNVLKAQRSWMTSKECTDPTIKSSREFCQQYFKLSAEHASGQEAEKHRAKIAQLSAQAAKATGAAVLGMADPQASVIARMTGLDLETVQTSLMLFVALLIEIGSGFGMYVAFAYWRPNQSLHGGPQPASSAAEAQPARKEEETQPTGKPDPIWSAEPAAATGPAVEVTADPTPPVVRRFGDNDNRNARPAIMPPSEVQRFYSERVDGKVGSNETLNDLYGEYCDWCKEQHKNALPMPTFSREFKTLGIRKEKIGGRVWYIGVRLRSRERAEAEAREKKLREPKARQAQEAAVEQPKPAVELRPAVDETAAAAEQLRAAADQMRVAVDQPEIALDQAKAA